MALGLVPPSPSLSLSTQDVLRGSWECSDFHKVNLDISWERCILTNLTLEVAGSVVCCTNLTLKLAGNVACFTKCL